MNQPSVSDRPGPLRPYVDPDGYFSLHVPLGWIIDSSGQQGTKVIFFHPQPDAGFRTNLNITVQPLKGVSSEEFLALTRLQLKQLTGRANPDADQPASRPVGGHLLEWSASFGPLPLRARQLVLMDDTIAYVVTATALAASFEVHRPAFEATLASFELRTPALDSKLEPPG